MRFFKNLSINGDAISNLWDVSLNILELINKCISSLYKDPKFSPEKNMISALWQESAFSLEKISVKYNWNHSELFVVSML